MILRDGPLSNRQILTWFDPDIPDGLPDHVVSKLLDGFWASEIAHRGLTDETFGSSTAGWNVRLDTLSRRMWYASPKTVARYRAASRLDLLDTQKKKLRPWQLEAWETTRAERYADLGKAKKKAETLLATLVSPKQFEHYKEFGEVMEPSTLHPDKVYILHKGVLAGNIDVFDDAVPILIDEDASAWVPRAVICSSPVEKYPDADLILTQLLHIRADETMFLQLANLHEGSWSPEEEAVRAARPFATVPRYDKQMGGWVNVPVDLTTGDCDYDKAREREAAEQAEDVKEQLVQQWGVWSQFVPDSVVADFRSYLGQYLRRDPKTEALMAGIEGIDEQDEVRFAAVEDIEDTDIALSFARRWLHRSVRDWLVALGLNEDDEKEEQEFDNRVMWFVDDELQVAERTLEEARRPPIVGARPLFSITVESQDDFELVDGP